MKRLNIMKTNKRVISQTEANKRTISADELAQFSRIYNVDVRELLFVDFTSEGEERDWRPNIVLSLNYLKDYLIVMLKMFIG